MIVFWVKVVPPAVFAARGLAAIQCVETVSPKGLRILSASIAGYSPAILFFPFRINKPGVTWRMGVARKIEHVYTYGEYLQWNDDERWELYEGVPVLMSPAPTPRHQGISMALAGFLAGKISSKSKGRVFAAPFYVRLPESNEADEDILTVVQPDVLITCDKSKLDRHGLRGAPDVVFEILSASTGSRDIGIKRDIYEKHGVREYWILDPVTKTAMLYTLCDGTYDKATVYTVEEGPPLKLFPEILLPLSEIFYDDDLPE